LASIFIQAYYPVIVKGVLAASLEVSLRVIGVIIRDKVCYSFKAKENTPLLKKVFLCFRFYLVLLWSQYPGL